MMLVGASKDMLAVCYSKKLSVIYITFEPSAATLVVAKKGLHTGIFH